MKREQKNELSRQRILDAAVQEFSEKGYEAASMNTICNSNGVSKGIIYHYFVDKADLYVHCVDECFGSLVEYLGSECQGTGDVEQRLQEYFDTRLRFFAANPQYLGIFLEIILHPPVELMPRLALVRQPFDELNERTLTDILSHCTLRSSVSIPTVVEDFRMYMDYFNARFHGALLDAQSPQLALVEHERLCHRQLSMLLYGVLNG